MKIIKHKIFERVSTNDLFNKLGRVILCLHLFQDILSDDGESAYSERNPTIAKLYVFNDKVNQVLIQKLKEFGGQKQGALGIIYADV